MNTTQSSDPQQMLDLIDETRRTTVGRLTRRYTLLLVVWAVAWALGFLALWVTEDVGAHSLLSPVAGWIVFAAAMLLAFTWSAVAGIAAAGDGIRGRSQLQGALYGFSWTIVMLCAFLLMWALQNNGLSAELAALLYPAVYVFLVGALYLSGGALWRGVPMYVLGVVLIITAVAATFAGVPTHYLVYAVVGPLAMLLVAGLMLAGKIPASIPEPA